jgi:molecular chaperone GrpE
MSHKKEQNENMQNENLTPQDEPREEEMEIREEVESLESPEELSALCKELQEEKDQLFNRLQRAIADLQNYQKKAVKERQESVHRTELNTIERFLLPMIDDLDRALKAAADQGFKTDDPLYAGVDMVRQHIFMMLKQLDIEPIEAEGKTFDPIYHEALMEVPTNDLPENTVVYAMSRGYTQKGKTFHPTRVAIAKPVKEEQKEEKPQNETEQQ